MVLYKYSILGSHCVGRKAMELRVEVEYPNREPFPMLGVVGCRYEYIRYGIPFSGCIVDAQPLPQGGIVLYNAAGTLAYGFDKYITPWFIMDGNIHVHQLKVGIFTIYNVKPR